MTPRRPRPASSVPGSQFHVPLSWPAWMSPVPVWASIPAPGCPARAVIRPAGSRPRFSTLRPTCDGAHKGAPIVRAWKTDPRTYGGSTSMHCRLPHRVAIECDKLYAVRWANESDGGEVSNVTRCYSHRGLPKRSSCEDCLNGLSVARSRDKWLGRPKGINV
jgi:hypothetical protein